MHSTHNCCRRKNLFHEASFPPVFIGASCVREQHRIAKAAHLKRGTDVVDDFTPESRLHGEVLIAARTHFVL